MVKFLDGIAAGVTLELARAPRYLRVVRDQDGVIDALDQLDDRPKPTESITVYRLVANHGTVHLSGRDKNGRRFGQWLQHADYAVLQDQPPDEVVRDNRRWAEWATAEAAKEAADVSQ